MPAMQSKEKIMEYIPIMLAEQNKVKVMKYTEILLYLSVYYPYYIHMHIAWKGCRGLKKIIIK